MSVTINDKVWKKLLKKVGEVARTPVRIGIVGDKAGQMTEDGKFTLAELAAVHEYGSRDGSIPARSFIRAPFEDSENINKLKAHQVKLSKKILLGTSGKQDVLSSLNLLGLWGQSTVQNWIRQRKVQPDILTKTKEKKGSDTPLIDEGILVNAINFKVGK